MATEFYGESPTSLTVSASPTPTTTTCTVNSATDLVVNQYVNIKVSGVFERTKITNISTNALTFDALSGAPDVPGEVRSTRSLIKTSTENQKGVYNADDLADLKTVDCTYAPAGLKYVNLETGRVYKYDPNSTATADDISVIQPTTGGGRFLQLSLPPKKAIANVGVVDSFGETSYTLLDGAGEPRWMQTASNVSDTITTGETSYTDVVGANITAPTATSGNNVLSGFCANAVGGNSSMVFHQGSADTSDISDFTYLTMLSMFFSNAASASSQTIKMQGKSDGVNNLVITSGVLWGAEIASTTAYGVYLNTSGVGVTDTSFTNVTGYSVTISPTNNRVLLLFGGRINQNGGGGTVENHFRFYDGSTGYGDIIWKNGTGASFEYPLCMGRVTGSLNGSTTFTLQSYSDTGTNNLNVANGRLIACEIVDDSQVFDAAATTSITGTTQAVLNDGSNDFELTLSPTEPTRYVIFLSGYLERTTGSAVGKLSLFLDSTELNELDSNWEDSANAYKSPVCVMAPTDRLSAGTYTIQAKGRCGDGSTDYDLHEAQLFAVEFAQITNGSQGDDASVTLSNLSAIGSRVTWDGQYVCSGNNELGVAIYEKVNAGAFTKVAEKLLASPGTNDQSMTLDWTRDSDFTEGDSVTYEVRAKTAAGTVDFAASRLRAQED